VTKFRHLAALGAVLMTAPATVAHAQLGSESKPFPERHPDPPQVIRMINFAGGFNLPIWMTQRQGFFVSEKIDIRIDFTPGSTYQLTHMIAGTYDMGFTALDNIIAYREGQNEAYLPPGTNVDSDRRWSEVTGPESDSIACKLRDTGGLNGPRGNRPHDFIPENRILLGK
jgi:ABC-type nitrate/sulfonate/bicarbonate transport system substrate-binding protein